MTSFFSSHGFSPGLARIQSMLESNSSDRRVDRTVLRECLQCRQGLSDIPVVMIYF